MADPFKLLPLHVVTFCVPPYLPCLLPTHAQTAMYGTVRSSLILHMAGVGWCAYTAVENGSHHSAQAPIPALFPPLTQLLHPSFLPISLPSHIPIILSRC